MLGLALRKAGLLTGPLITTFHGIDLARYPRQHGQDCYRWLFEGAAALTVNSRFAETRALALGAPPHILHRLPVGVDLDSIPFQPPSPPTSGPFRLLSVGRLEEVKGISFGLRAVQALVDRGVDVRYTVVGDGRLKQALRTEAVELGIDSVVHFTGALSLPRVVEEMQQSHLFLMPGVETGDRQAETQGRVLVEAQAVGLPIVASRVGGIPETLGPGAGVLVEPRDVTGLADALDRVLGKTAEWKDIARSGRTHVERVFDQATLLDRLVSIYRGVADPSGVNG
jgi:colanic acid/amylovoran biosynthesis glycosyltransferase